MEKILTSFPSRFLSLLLLPLYGFLAILANTTIVRPEGLRTRCYLLLVALGSSWALFSTTAFLLLLARGDLEGSEYRLAERGFTHKQTRLRGGAYSVTVQREVVGSWRRSSFPVVHNTQLDSACSQRQHFKCYSGNSLSGRTLRLLTPKVVSLARYHD